MIGYNGPRNASQSPQSSHGAVRDPGPALGHSPFGEILRRAVHTTPRAIGGAFADPDGEMIDGFTTRDPHDWALVTAHYGIVLSQLHAAFGTWHFGGPEYFIAQLTALDIVVHASTQPEPFGRVIVEAMACRKAVVSSGIGGAGEILSLGEVGDVF